MRRTSPSRRKSSKLRLRRDHDDLDSAGPAAGGGGGAAAHSTALSGRDQPSQMFVVLTTVTSLEDFLPRFKQSDEACVKASRCRGRDGGADQRGCR